MAPTMVRRHDLDDQIERRWQDRAACLDEDPEVFHRASYDAESRAEVEAICRDCPVSGSCLAFALRSNEHGVWAGTTYDERRAMAP